MKKITLIGIGLVALAPLALRAEDAAANFEKYCAACHGKDGKGDTKMGKKLEIKDFTDAKVQGDLKDEDMIKAIKEGIKDKDGKLKMKPFGEKLSDADIQALVAYVRGLKK